MTDFSDSENSSKQEVDVGIMPKVEDLDYDLPSENMYSSIMAVWKCACLNFQWSVKWFSICGSLSSLSLLTNKRK